MSKILLETKNLKKVFEHKNGNINLFDSVNIKIKRGDLVALTGPSGSGKSSFLHLLALLDNPTKGQILLENKDVKNFNTNINKKRQDLIKFQNNARGEFSKKLKPILEDYSSKNSIVMILRKENLLLGKKSLDITKNILELFNKNVKKITVQ